MREIYERNTAILLQLMSYLSAQYSQVFEVNLPRQSGNNFKIRLNNSIAIFSSRIQLKDGYLSKEIDNQNCIKPKRAGIGFNIN